MIDNLNFGIELTVCEIIFGLPTYNNPDLKLINFLIIIGKWYLNLSKTQNNYNLLETLRNVSIINNEVVES